MYAKELSRTGLVLYLTHKYDCNGRYLQSKITFTSVNDESPVSSWETGRQQPGVEARVKNAGY